MSALPNWSTACGTAIIGVAGASPSWLPPPPACVTNRAACFSIAHCGTPDRPSTFSRTGPSSVRSQGPHFDVAGQGAEFGRVHVPADLEHEVPAGEVAEGPDAFLVEIGPPGERGAERDQRHLLRSGRPLPLPLGATVALTGADEG